MATVDELKILIKAETKQLKKELGEVNKKLEKTNKEAKKATDNMSAGFKKVAIGATALVAGTAKLASSIAAVGSDFEDLKDSLNVVFGSMEAGDKAMGRVLQFAQTTPFQIETVTKAFIALKSAGIEPTNRMLQTFADTASVSTDQLGVFEALVRITQRSAGGGLGLEELNMLSDRGLPALVILKEELGLAKDEIAAFGQTADGANKIVKALTAGLEARFGGAMANKMDNLSTKTSNMQIAFKELANEIFEGGLGDGLKSLADSLTEMANSITRSLSAFRGVGTGTALTSPIFTSDMDAGQRNDAIISAAEENIRRLEANLAAAQGQGSDNPQRAGAQPIAENRATLISNINDELKEQRDLIDRIRAGQGVLSEEQKENLMIEGEQLRSKNFILKMLQKEKGNIDDVALALEHLDVIYHKNSALFTAEGIASKAELAQKLEDIRDKGEEVESALEQLQPIIDESVNKFSNDFVQSLMDGENAMDSFKDLFKDMARQIIASALQMQVIKPIMDAMFAAVGLPVSAAAAGGGRVQKGQPTLVGERGAEIFVPQTHGTIMNNMNSKNALSGGGGITVVQHNNFALGVGATARAEVAKLLPQIQESSKAAVLEAAARGGSFRRGLAGG